VLRRVLVVFVVVALAGPAAAGAVASTGAGTGAAGPFAGRPGLLGLPPLAPPALPGAAGGEVGPGEEPRAGTAPGEGVAAALWKAAGEAEADPEAAAPGEGDAEAAPAAPAPDGGPEDDFDLFGDTARREAELADPGLEKDIARRRSMLRTHQILGLTTLGLMAATAIVGQVNYANTYADGADGDDGLRVPHMVLSYTTTAAFATTAAFSLFAPDPVQRESTGIDTVTLHQLAVIGATAGMLAQAGLGFSAARSADAGHPTRPGDLAAIHQVIGWTTLGFMTAAAAVWLF
jgi:hypothetical protein